MKTYIVIALLLLAISAPLMAQSLTVLDSTLLNNAKNDTTLLRQIVTNRPGVLIAAKAQIRIGIILYNAKNEDKAEQEFFEVYNHFSGQKEAYKAESYMGKIAYHNGKYDIAKNYFSDFMNSNPNLNDAADAEYHLALIAYKTDKEDISKQKFLLVYSQYQNQRESKLSAYYLGSIAFHKEDYDSAKQYLAEYLQSYPTGKLAIYAKYHLLKAKLQTNDSDYVDYAHQFLLESHDSVKIGNAAIQYELVNYLSNNNRYELALTEAKKMIQKYPDYSSSMQVRFQIGEFYLLLNKPQKAIDQYNFILNMTGIEQKQKARAQYEIGGVYDSQNDYENALHNYLFVKTQYPNEAKWVIASEYSVAMALYRQGLNNSDSLHQSSGLPELENFVNQHPTDHHAPRALNAIADIYVSSKRYTDAIQIYDRIAGFDTTLLPINQRKEKKHDEVKTHKTLVNESLKAKAKLYRDKMQRPLEAISIYDSILSVSPNNGEVKLNKALCLIDLNQKTEAKSILEQLVQQGGKQKTHAAHILLTLK